MNTIIMVAKAAKSAKKTKSKKQEEDEASDFEEEIAIEESEEESEEESDNEDEDEDEDEDKDDDSDYEFDGSDDESVGSALYDADENDADSVADDDIENKCSYSYAIPEEKSDIIPDMTRVPDDERITEPVMSMYEIVRILGTRTHQISCGAEVRVKNIQDRSPVEAAIAELEHKTTPIKIHRPLPNNTYEVWKVSELELKPGFDYKQLLKIDTK